MSRVEVCSSCCLVECDTLSGHVLQGQCIGCLCVQGLVVEFKTPTGHCSGGCSTGVEKLRAQYLFAVIEDNHQEGGKCVRVI